MFSQEAVRRNGHSAHRTSSTLLLEQLLGRRSVHPRWLVEPGPSEAETRNLIRAACTAIDHDGLRPWRFIGITGADRQLLADIFVRIKRSHNPSISQTEIQREKDRASGVLLLIAVVDKSHSNPNAVPVHEQIASVGAAVQNIVLCAHLMGFGAKMVSGNKVNDPRLQIALRLHKDESLFGFVCIGTATAGTNHKRRPTVDDVYTHWTPTACHVTERASVEVMQEII